MAELLFPPGWEQTIADFHGLCAYCQERPYQELEHFIPRKQGGKTDIANCLPACRECNSKKSDRTGDALIGMFGIATIERLRLYLESRSGKPIVVSNMESSVSNKKTLRVRLVIRSLAEKQGVTQKSLSKRSGVTVQLLNRYWNNHVQRVDLDELEKIAIALQVKVGDLIVSDREVADGSNL